MPASRHRHSLVVVRRLPSPVKHRSLREPIHRPPQDPPCPTPEPANLQHQRLSTRAWHSQLHPTGWRVGDGTALKRLQLSEFTCNYVASGLLCHSDSGDTCVLLLGVFDVPLSVEGTPISEGDFNIFARDESGNCRLDRTFIASKRRELS